jgi:hypothetical protein
MTISLKQIDEKQSTEQIIPPDAGRISGCLHPVPGLCSLAGWVSRRQAAPVNSSLAGKDPLEASNGTR